MSVIQDAPSEFAHQFMYPGGGFALGNALGWVQIVDRMFRADGGTARHSRGACRRVSPPNGRSDLQSSPYIGRLGP
ncbi:MAG TPA: hypothetical protein VI094_20670 [Propionibacteriaceae bacterium]